MKDIPMAYTSGTPFTCKNSSTYTPPPRSRTCSKPLLLFRYSVAGATPTPMTITSAGSVVVWPVLDVTTTAPA